MSPAVHRRQTPAQTAAAAAPGRARRTGRTSARSAPAAAGDCRSRKLTGDIISTANAPTLKSNPTVPQIIKRPIAATAIPVICIGVGISRNAIAANATVNSAWLCTITLASPTGTWCAIAQDCARNCPRNSVPLIAISTVQETFGRRTNRHGTAAMAKRIAVISAGESSSSASRLRDEPEPPDHRHQDGQTNVGRLHRRRSSFARPASVSAADRCRAAARDNPPRPA